MPPKRPPKRRQDEDGPSRPPKKSGKNKREVTYDTYDEAMDGGVELEEKGERYKDGDKAQRFYERALDLYKKAYDFDQTYDAAYNQARVLLILGTQFILPTNSFSYLTSSIELFRHAVTLTDSVVLQLDAGYNLARALIELADTIEDIHPDRREQITRTRHEAREILEGVLAGQNEYIMANAEEVELDQASDIAAEEDQSAVEAAAALPVEGGVESNEGDDGMEVDTTKEEDKATAYETQVPTPTSLIDTALELLDLHLTLWTTVEPSAHPTPAQQSAVRSILDLATQHTTPGRQAEIDLAEIKVLLAMDEIVWSIFKTQAELDTGIEKSLEGAISALTALLASLDVVPPEEPTLRADILLILAETHFEIAHRLLFLSPQLPPGPSPLAQGAWYNLAQIVAHLTTALELPHHKDVPKTFKASVLFRLSKASLARAKLASINETAKRNARQLVDNATTYATRAIDAVGWAPALGLSQSTTIGGRPTPPWSSGWDAEYLARSAILQLLRISHVVLTSNILDEDKATFEQSGRDLVGKIKSIQDVDRRIGSADIRRWVEEVEDEEPGIAEEEKVWWAALAEELART